MMAVLGLVILGTTLATDVLVHYWSPVIVLLVVPVCAGAICFFASLGLDYLLVRRRP